MRTRDMLGGHLGMTFATVNRIESAPVPALVGADMAIEAFRRTVNGAFEEVQVDFVAIVTGICLFCIARLQCEGQAGKEKGQGGDELAHGNALCSGYFRRFDACSNYEPSLPISQ
jgi:hypothetical protein